MSDPQPQVDPPRSESFSEQRARMDDPGSLPRGIATFDRQFQQIDAPTRSEAERQIADFEQIFRRRMEETSQLEPV